MRTIEDLLVTAVYQNQVDTVTEILKSNPTIKRNPTLLAEGGSYTVMHEAAEKGFVEVMQALTDAEKFSNKRGAMLEAKGGSDRWTPLHMAAYAGQAKAVSWLLEQSWCHYLSNSFSTKYIDPNPYAIHEDDTQGITPLMLAAGAGHLEIVTSLLRCINNTKTINIAVTEGKMTPLSEALNNGHHQVAKQLLSHGALISSYSAWNTWFEKHGLAGALQLCSPLEQLQDQLSLILGYAVLQQIKKSILPDVFWGDACTVFRDCLEAMLKGIEAGDLSADDIEETIRNAVEHWEIDSDVQTYWLRLSTFISLKPFSSNKDIPALVKTVDDSYQKNLDRIFGSDVANMLAPVIDPGVYIAISRDENGVRTATLTANGQTDTYTMPEEEDTPSHTVHVLRLSEAAKAALQYVPGSVRPEGT